MLKYLMMKGCFEHYHYDLHRHRVMTLDHYWLRIHHCHYDGERKLYYYFFYVDVELHQQQDLLLIVVVEQLVQAKINYQRRYIYYYYSFHHHHVVVYLFFHYCYYDSQKKNSIASIYYSFYLTTETAAERSSPHPIDSSLAKNTRRFPVEYIRERAKTESCAATEHTPLSIEYQSGSSSLRTT